MLFAPSGKGRKRQKKGEKGRFRPISGKGSQTLLKPPFAAAQPSLNLSEIHCVGFLYVLFPFPTGAQAHSDVHLREAFEAYKQRHHKALGGKTESFPVAQKTSRRLWLQWAKTRVFWRLENLGQKSCRTKVSRIFVTNVGPNFDPKFKPRKPLLKNTEPPP